MPALTPDPDAEAFADEMLAREDLLRELLEETLNAAGAGGVREAGRTICGPPADNDVRKPRRRAPTSIDLAGCGADEKTGIWHTHVSRPELLRPSHSIPDYANVVFGLADASVVVGAEHAHAVIAAADQEAMEREFRNALGADVDSPAAVLELVERPDFDPIAANDRVERALSPLVRTPPTNFEDLANAVAQASGLADPIPAAQTGSDGCCALGHRRDRGAGVAARSRPDRLRRQSRRTGKYANNALPGDMSLTTEVATTIVGTAISLGVKEVLF